MQMARVAAHNMVGIPSIYNEVPFLTMKICDTGFRMAGLVSTFDDVIIDGSLDPLNPNFMC